MNLLRLLFIFLSLTAAHDTLRAFQQEAGPRNLEPKQTESWTNLSLEGSEFISAPPLLGQTDSQPLFTRHLVRLEWRPGDPIDTFVIVPKPPKHDVPEGKPAPKPPVILYLYNYATNTDRFMLNNVGEHLTADGVAAVGFSLALSGHRFRNRGAWDWFVSEFQEALTTSTHDVQKVIDYLQTRHDVDTTRIGVYGQGSGAAVAILTAAVDPRIKVLDLEDAWGDWPAWLSKSALVPEDERPKYLTAEFLKKVKDMDPVQHLPQLKIPVRLQYSLPKSAVPPEVRKRMQSAVPPQGDQTPVEANFNWIKKKLSEMGAGTKSSTKAGAL